jgi:hypothetical protein
MSSRTVCVISLVFLSIVAASPVRAQSAAPSSRWVEIGKPFVAKRGNGIVLVQTITSTASKEKSWALVEMDGSDETAACDWMKVLEAKQSYRFECALKNPAGVKFSTRVRIFKDAELDDRELLYEPEFTVTTQQIAAAEAVASTVAVVPPGTFEAMTTPLPATFKPTWYRRIDKGFGMKAYENSGDLTVSADEILFVDGKKTVRVPIAKISSVRWEPLPNDIANHWIVVKFTNDDGKPDGIAFRDGARMGTRGRSGPIYEAVRQTKK